MLHRAIVARVTSIVIILSAVMLAAGPAHSAGPVMQMIPADAIGYVVVGNAKAFSDRVDAFLVSSGIAPMVSMVMPNGMLQAIQTGALLGEGFDPQAGFAFVMLDPQAFGIDVVAWIDQPEAPGEQRRLPFVILLGGSSIQSVFGAYPITPEGDFQKVQLRMGEMFAAEHEGMIALSSMAEALSALLAAEKSADQAIDADGAALLCSADIAIHLDVAKAWPILDRLFETFKQKLTEQDQASREMASLAMVLPIYREMLSQIQTVTAAGQFDPAGLIIQKHVRFQADSPLGKIIACHKTDGGDLFSRVPDNAFILALGIASPSPEVRAEVLKFNTQMLERMMQSEAMADIPAELVERLNQTAMALNEQTLGAQFVLGQSPEGAGVVGLACVLEVQDQAKTRQLLAEYVGPYEEFIKAILKKTKTEDGQDQKKEFEFDLVYTAGAESIDEKPVDVLEIRIPDIEAMTEEDRQEMAKYLADDKLLVRIASAGDNLVVLTLGGGKSFLSQAIETAASADGKILTSPDVRQAMSYMPENRIAVGLFQLSNLFGLCTRIGQMEEQVFPLAAQNTIPLAIGVGAKGNALQASLFVPSGMIKDVMNVVMMSMMGPTPPPQQDNAEELESQDEENF